MPTFVLFFGDGRRRTDYLKVPEKYLKTSTKPRFTPKKMKRISKEELARRLACAVGLEDGKEGLGILIYGWFHYRRYGKRYRKAVYNRDWLYIVEVQDLSEYVGYDLTVCPS